MTMTQERKRPTGRRPQYALEPSPYNLAKPLEPAPARIRHDPRIPTQRRTAFWVVVKDQHVGRVTMVEFEDRAGWWYQAEVIDPAHPGSKPKPFGEPHARRKLAIEAVVDEWRVLRREAGQNGDGE